MKLFESKSMLNKVMKELKQHEGSKKGVEMERNLPASIMYTGGTIRPLAGGVVETVVEAIGFHGGKVVAAGSKSDVTAEMNSVAGKYIVEELSKGQTLLPGLIEPHVHIVSTALTTADWNDIGPFDGQNLRNIYDLSYVKEKVETIKVSLPNGFWVLGYGLDPSLMPFVLNKDALNVLQRLDVDTVDKIELAIPVFTLSASGHTVYINTVALRAVYDLGHSGYPTFEAYREHVNDNGGLQELEEIVPALGAIPGDQILQTILKLKGGLDAYFELATKRGVTMLYDAAMSPEQKLILELYLAFTPFRVRIGYAELCNSPQGADNIGSYEPVTAPLKLFQGSVKIVADGSNQGLTGYQYEPYRCEPAKNYGLFNFSVEDINYMVKTLISKGWPLMIHGNGNRAISTILDAYEAGLGRVSGLDKRHRIEHCSLLDETALQRMSNLGISPSFLIGHVGYWGYVFKKAIFEEKAETLDVCQSALKKNMRVTLHTDYFVSPLGPLRMMEQGITRIMEQDPQLQVLNASEKLTPAQALRTVTYDAAWQCHADQFVGSLEKNKFADYVILAEDPITKSNPVGMRDIPVLETWVGGVKMITT